MGLMAEEAVISQRLGKFGRKRASGTDATSSAVQA
jgi:hypothetical protein